MKSNVLYALAFSAIALFACGNAETETTTEETPVVESVTYSADVNASMVNWRGEVAGVYGHEGFVKLSSGAVTLNGDAVTGGEFTIDMTGIFPTDSASYTEEEGHRASDLQGHLSTEDFFATATYPTSTFVITSVEGNMVKGNLTIRDKTNEETIEITSSEVTESGVKISGKMTFNRQNYDVAWVHFMKDMILSDDIALTITLVATK
jgi:polyisoprenoid-binding protein YceI